MESLLKLLPLMISLSGDHEEVREQAAFAAWRVTTGQQLSHTCQPFRLFRTCLVVAVTDETWKKQMETMSAKLIFRINSLLGQALVTFIEFRVDPAQVAKALGKTECDPRVPTDPDLTAELGASVARIDDEELRELFVRVAAINLARKPG